MLFREPLELLNSFWSIQIDFSITLAHKLSRYLVDLTVCGSFKAYPIPGWYVPSDDRLSKRDERFLDGHINYGMAHGITGVLASLVKLGEHGVNKPRLMKQ